MALPMEKRYTEEEYYKYTGENRCELIDGYIVDLSSPSPVHQKILGKIDRQIGNFIDSHHGKCEPYITTNVKLDAHTIVEPDLFVTCDPNNFDERQYNGAPDWVIEIVSKSNPSWDYCHKLDLYKENGVREYWIVDPRVFVTTVHIWDGDYRFSDAYSFAQKIPVHIFKDKTPPLEICIGDYLKDIDE
ncbi:MAG: Uma2 family endonuclease [Ruminococcus sp.]|nr:Uma2 family endonuclease [Ruminococcus sp.]